VILSTPIVCIALVIINIFIILHGHTMKLPTWCHFISFFIAQHVSNVITFILRSWRLYVGVLLCFVVYWCIGAVRLEWCGIWMQVGARSMIGYDIWLSTVRWVMTHWSTIGYGIWLSTVWWVMTHCSMIGYDKIDDISCDSVQCNSLWLSIIWWFMTH
jgi:hypothetical protein